MRGLELFVPYLKVLLTLTMECTPLATGATEGGGGGWGGLKKKIWLSGLDFKS